VRISIYNYIHKLDKDVTLFFNTFTLALLALKRPEARLARRILEDPDGPCEGRAALKTRRLFLDHGFLVADGVDEREFLKAQNAWARSHSKSMNLTIVPTLACNFRCKYCYQTKVPETMSTEVEESLVRYVEDNIGEKESLNVTWFGGEPLLRMDIIERLSSRFLEICASGSTKYGAGIVTNGYFLDAEVSKRLSQLGVVDAQVTVDGPADIHDLRRPLDGGGRTFEKIMANISEASAHLKIQVRMNVDDENRSRILDLLDLLGTAGLKERLGFYLGQTYPYTNVCQGVAALCLKDDDFSLLELETALEMTKRGFVSHPTPRSKNVYCMAESPCSYGITPNGGLVKCWNEVSNPEAEVGHLLRPETERMRENRRRWLGRDVFESECRDCLSLPICMGGCPYIHRQTGALHCLDWKHHPEECLVFYYYLRKMKQETEIVLRFWESLESYQKNGSFHEFVTTPDTGKTNADRRVLINEQRKDEKAGGAEPAGQAARPDGRPRRS